MIKFSKDKVLLLHKLIAEETGGSVGVRDSAQDVLLPNTPTRKGPGYMVFSKARSQGRWDNRPYI